jgi:hypothetical protein
MIIVKRGKMSTIVISTKSEMHNQWQTFSCWYSINSTLPTWKVAVVFQRNNKAYQFSLLNRCNIPYLAYPRNGKESTAIQNLLNGGIISLPVVIVQDNHMIIRDIEEPLEGIVEAKTLSCFGAADSQDLISIVDYSTCGKFDLKTWQEKEKTHPFHKAMEFTAKNRTVNEQRVMQLWRQMALTYDFLVK